MDNNKILEDFKLKAAIFKLGKDYSEKDLKISKNIILKRIVIFLVTISSLFSIGVYASKIYEEYSNKEMTFMVASVSDAVKNRI